MGSPALVDSPGANHLGATLGFKGSSASGRNRVQPGNFPVYSSIFEYNFGLVAIFRNNIIAANIALDFYSEMATAAAKSEGKWGSVELGTTLGTGRAESIGVWRWDIYRVQCVVGI